MKVKRYKKIRKILAFYNLSHGIHPPYRVIVDPEFIQACREGKVMIINQLEAMFHAQTTVNVTQCALNWMEKQGEKFAGALFIAKTLTVTSCKHKDNKGKLEPHACIKAAVQYKHKHKPNPANNQSKNDLLDGSLSQRHTREYNSDCLIVGAQQSDLREWIRAKPGTPLLFVHGSVPTLEQPNELDRVTDHKAEVPEIEAKALDKIRKAQPNTQQIRRPVKKVKGPNPLSVKKKQKKPNNQPSTKQSNNQTNNQTNNHSSDATQKVGSKRSRESSEESNNQSNNQSNNRTDSESSTSKRSKHDTAAVAVATAE